MEKKANASLNSKRMVRSTDPGMRKKKSGRSNVRSCIFLSALFGCSSILTLCHMNYFFFKFY
jgi:hypothetical protein